MKGAVTMKDDYLEDLRRSPENEKVVKYAELINEKVIPDLNGRQYFDLLLYLISKLEPQDIPLLHLYMSVPDTLTQLKHPDPKTQL